MSNLTIGILILALAILACGGSQQAAPPAKRSVEYRIETGTPKEISITYQNAGGDTSQEKTNSPWSKKFDAAPGQFIYLSAQLLGTGATSITCIVMVDGKEFKRTESKGEFVIASCSGQVP